MTEFQSRLHDLDSCIENAKKERLNHDSLKLQWIAFKDNNSIIENSIDQQKVVLNKYISNLQLMLSISRGEDDEAA